MSLREVGQPVLYALLVHFPPRETLHVQIAINHAQHATKLQQPVFLAI